MSKLVLCLALVVTGAACASKAPVSTIAQRQIAHPCDEPEVTLGRQPQSTTLKARLCTDVDPAELQALVLYRDGVAQSMTAFTLLTTSPNATGQRQFESVIGVLPRGTYVFTATVIKNVPATDSTPAELKESPQSSPFSFLAVDVSPPTAPDHVRILR